MNSDSSHICEFLISPRLSSSSSLSRLLCLSTLRPRRSCHSMHTCSPCHCAALLMDPTAAEVQQRAEQSPPQQIRVAQTVVAAVRDRCLGSSVLLRDPLERRCSGLLLRRCDASEAQWAATHTHSAHYGGSQDRGDRPPTANTGGMKRAALREPLKRDPQRSPIRAHR